MDNPQIWVNAHRHRSGIVPGYDAVARIEMDYSAASPGDCPAEPWQYHDQPGQGYLAGVYDLGSGNDGGSKDFRRAGFGIF